jgi:hypothetical protein
MSQDSPSDRNLFDKVAQWLAPPGDRRGTRGWLAQVFALLGTALAGLQLLLSTFDEANRLAARLSGLLPYVVPLAFAAGAVTALYFVFSQTTTASHRRWGIVALALIVVSGAAWGGWTYYEEQKPPKAVIIAIADFDNQKATVGVDWGRRIFERVDAEVRRLELGDRVEVRRVFESFGDGKAARARGDDLKATLVLWGWYDDAGVSPHFEATLTMSVSLPASEARALGSPSMLATAMS